MKKLFLQITAFFIFLLIFSANANAHCEIPCGIYDDGMRIQMIREHIGTIEKSMKQIIELEKAGTQNHSNQLVRWIMNKEKHADAIQEIVSQYFMTQRIKLDAKNYDKKLSILHHILVYAMKCKQTTDPDNTEALKNLIKNFEDLYFEK